MLYLNISRIFFNSNRSTNMKWVLNFWGAHLQQAFSLFRLEHYANQETKLIPCSAQIDDLIWNGIYMENDLIMLFELKLQGRRIAHRHRQLRARMGAASNGHARIRVKSERATVRHIYIYMAANDLTGARDAIDAIDSPVLVRYVLMDTTRNVHSFCVAIK